MSDLTPKPVRETPYLTVISDRRPRQKAHATRGHAHSALSVRCWFFRPLALAGAERAYRLGADAALYVWEGNDWRLLWEGKRGDRIDRDAPAWKEAK